MIANLDQKATFIQCGLEKHGNRISKIEEEMKKTNNKHDEQINALWTNLVDLNVKIAEMEEENINYNKTLRIENRRLRNERMLQRDVLAVLIVLILFWMFSVKE